MTYLPQSYKDKRPNKQWTDEDRRNQTSGNILNNVVPYDANKPYDMKIIIENVVDRNDFFELMPEYAKNISTGFGEVEGRVIGIVANQP